MRKFLTAAAMSLFIFGGLSQAEASTVQNLDNPIAQTQDIETQGKWAHFRDKYILGREAENERRAREQWEQKHNAREQWEKERRTREQWEKERRTREQWEKERRAREEWDRRHRYNPPSSPPRNPDRYRYCPPSPHHSDRYCR